MGIICGPGSFEVQFGDHLRSGIICGPGIICGAVLLSLACEQAFLRDRAKKAGERSGGGGGGGEREREGGEGESL